MAGQSTSYSTAPSPTTKGHTRPAHGSVFLPAHLNGSEPRAAQPYIARRVIWPPQTKGKQASSCDGRGFDSWFHRGTFADPLSAFPVPRFCVPVLPEIIPCSPTQGIWLQVVNGAHVFCTTESNQRAKTSEFAVFSRPSGNWHLETGSPPTASTTTHSGGFCRFPFSRETGGFSDARPSGPVLPSVSWHSDRPLYRAIQAGFLWPL